MKRFFEKIKAIANWIAVDGLLHIETCYAMMLTLQPMVDIWWAKAITATCAIGKEVVDVLRGKNTWEQARHDLICDGAGILMADVTIFVWWLSNL